MAWVTHPWLFQGPWASWPSLLPLLRLLRIASNWFEKEALLRTVYHPFKVVADSFFVFMLHRYFLEGVVGCLDVWVHVIVK